MTERDRGKTTDELEEIELVVDLADGPLTEERLDEAPPAPDTEDEEAPEPAVRAETEEEKEIRLDREQTLHDLRELQELSLKRATGQSTDD